MDGQYQPPKFFFMVWGGPEKIICPWGGELIFFFPNRKKKRFTNYYIVLGACRPIYLSFGWGIPGGLVERWVRGCAAQIGCFFGRSGFPMTLFLFENWFRYRSHFCKMHNFRWIFPFSLPIGCQKVLMHPNLYGKKYWLVLKRVLQEANGLVIGCKFASSLLSKCKRVKISLPNRVKLL